MEQEIKRIKSLLKQRVSKEEIEKEIAMLIPKYGINMVVDKLIFVEFEYQFGKSA